MTGCKALTIDLQDWRPAERPTTGDRDDGLFRQEWWGAVRLVSLNLLVSVFYGLFAYASVQSWLTTGSLLSVGLVVVNTLIVICFLARRAPSMVSCSIRNWFVASSTQLLPLLLRSAVSECWPVLVASSVGQLLGLSIMLASLLSLRRSIGVVAANRGIKTHGIYSLIRHPLYLGEMIFFLSFMAANWTLPNALVVSALVIGQLSRLFQEESFLACDETYVRYCQSVQYRLIPGLF
jgi:protein-S-isoprenylcysteine O-methyltransferase Ste14